MARSLYSNPLRLKPRTLRSQGGSSGASITQEDFEPRLRFYLDEVRRQWPGAPASWKEAIRLRQWPSAFPGLHWAAVECLLELGRAASGAPKAVAHAWQTLALGVVHVIVDGGGLPNTMPTSDLAGLLNRVDECHTRFSELHKSGLVSLDVIVEVIERYRKHPEVRADGLRAGFVAALRDVIQFRQRLHAPATGDIIGALHYVIIANPHVFQQALQLSQPESNVQGSKAVSSVVPLNESDALLQSLLKVENQMGVADEQSAPPVRGPQRPRGLDAPISRASSPERARSLPKASPPRLVQRTISGAPRRSDTKTESAWSQSQSRTLDLPNGLPLLGVLVSSACLLMIVVALTGHWTSKARGAGEEVQERLTGLPNPLDTAEAFAYAETATEKISFLHDPKDAADAREHFDGPGESEFNVELVQMLGLGRSGGLSFHASRIRFEDGRSRLLAILTDPKTGKLSVDWDAYVRRTSMPWSTIAEGRGDGAEVRVFARRGSYYNFGFEDTDQVASYELSSPDTDEIFYGYVERGSTRHALMEELLIKKRLQRMVLRLRVPTAEVEATQYWISAVIANDWILDPAGPLEDSAFAF